MSDRAEEITYHIHVAGSNKQRPLREEIAGTEIPGEVQRTRHLDPGWSYEVKIGRTSIELEVLEFSVFRVLAHVLIMLFLSSKSWPEWKPPIRSRMRMPSRS